MNEDILRKIEVACEQVFNAPTADGRQLAEQQLAGFSRVESVGELKLLMEKSTNAYALFYAATQMLKLFTTNWNSFSKEQKNEIRMLLYIPVCVHWFMEVQIDPSPRFNSFFDLDTLFVFTLVFRNQTFHPSLYD